jgi:hypothetical protein
MLFLFVLNCSMVFFSRERREPKESVDPPKPVTSPHTRKPRNRSASAKQADATLADRLWVKNQLDPEREKLRFPT